MRSDSRARVIASLYEAAASPDLWPTALKSLAETLDEVGAAYVIHSKRTGRAEWACFSGPSAELTAEYLSYYSLLSPYRPVLDAAPSGRWIRLSRCLPEAVLRRDEWYNDFILKSGIGDVLGACVFDSDTHTAYFGIHQGTRPELSRPTRAARYRQLIERLSAAVRLHLEFRRLAWQFSVGSRALDQVAAGVIITDSDARVIEMDLSAEGVIRLDDGLTIRNGLLGAERTFESAKLTKLIAAACSRDGGSVGRMLIGKCHGRPAHVLTVTPLRAEARMDGRALAMIVVADLRGRSPSARDMAEFFGLSQAESRLAAALMTGKMVRDIAAASGVKITTLRTQLSSVLKKVGVRRQADLVRVLSNIQVFRSGQTEPHGAN